MPPGPGQSGLGKEVAKALAVATPEVARCRASGEQGNVPLVQVGPLVGDDTGQARPLLDGRPREDVLQRACAAGAFAASRFGAQTSLPTTEELDALL